MSLSPVATPSSPDAGGVDTEVVTSGARMKAILGGATGNLVEWYDWYAYSAFTLYFAPHFFPSADPTAQLLGAAAVFAVGFFMRPLGAWMMGIYADRKGRKSGLALSVTLMCAGSLLIAVSPTYESVGLLAPAVLLIARLLQGLSVGGEYGASATYLSEMAGKKRRGFYSSFQYVTLIGGQLVAIGVLLLLQAVMTEADLEAWGWRIPFAIGAVLAVVVFWIRRGLAETESFKNAQGTDAPKSGAIALVQASSARSDDGDAADCRWHARLLRLLDLHAEIPGQHLGFLARDRVADQRREPVSLHASAAGRGRAIGSDRAQAAADRFRGGRLAVHLSFVRDAGDARAIR